MAAPGETDLAKMLATLDVERRVGEFTFVEVDDIDLEVLAVAEALVRETDSTTLVLDVDAARAAGLDASVRMAWLSLTVQSSLEAVGLTAAFAKALGDEGIPCNVLAGYRHDHLLVPVGRANDAIRALRSLAG